VTQIGLSEVFIQVGTTKTAGSPIMCDPLLNCNSHVAIEHSRELRVIVVITSVPRRGIRQDEVSSGDRAL
jgi:hypothetical protein